MTVAIIAGETLILLLMAVLVAGLLRSHAELLVTVKGRAERTERPPAATSGSMEIDPRLPAVAGDRSAISARPLTGTRLDGTEVTIDLHGRRKDVLLAFLSSGCGTCDAFWAVFHERRFKSPAQADVIVVAKDPEMESSSQLMKKAPPKLPLVMSGQAWVDYDVPASPYFVFVDVARQEIAGEGAASTWAQVERLLQDAVADRELAADRPGAQASRLELKLTDSHPARIAQADAALIAAGLSPDDPSLWEGGSSGPPASADAD